MAVSFETWMEHVEEEFDGIFGGASWELPETIDYHELYEQRTSAKNAAIEVLRDAGYYDFQESWSKASMF